MKGSLVLSLILPLLVVAATEGRPPNIEILYADDLGIGYVGCCGCTDIATPQFDALARGSPRTPSAAGCAFAGQRTPHRGAIDGGRLTDAEGTRRRGGETAVPHIGGTTCRPA